MPRKKVVIPDRPEPTLADKLQSAKDQEAAYASYIVKLLEDTYIRLRNYAEEIERYKDRQVEGKYDLEFAVSQTLNTVKSITFNLRTDTLAKLWADYVRVQGYIRLLEAEIERKSE